jgi:hypothetical protein
VSHDTTQPDPHAVRALTDRLARLEQRVVVLEDELALRELLHAYSVGADIHRDERWVDLFTSDGVYDLGEHAAPGASTGQFRGAAALRELVQGPGMPRAGHSQHHHGPMAFRVDGDDAEAESYSVTLEHDGDCTRVYCAGFSRWRFRRVDGRWRIAERSRRELGAPDQAEVSGHLRTTGRSSSDAAAGRA